MIIFVTESSDAGATVQLTGAQWLRLAAALGPDVARRGLFDALREQLPANPRFSAVLRARLSQADRAAFEALAAQLGD